jgi:predicted aspartyl protease
MRMRTNTPPCPRDGLTAALILLTASFASAVTAAAGTDPVARLNFELGPRGHVLVPVTVNGERALFALDTGAGSNVVAKRYAEASGSALPDHGEAATAGAHAKGKGSLTRIDTLGIGSIEARDEPALVMDLSHVEDPDTPLDGLIGRPLLEDYDVVLDFAGSTVSFYPQGALDRLGVGQPHTRSGMIEAADSHDQLVFLDVRYGDVGLTAVLDTGSGRSGINSAAAAALGIELPGRAAPAPDHAGGHGPVAALPTMEIELGAGHLRSAQPVAIVDLPVFETLGLADRPAMLLGTNFLRGRRIGLDYAGRRIFLFD